MNNYLDMRTDIEFDDFLSSPTHLDSVQSGWRVYTC